MIDYFVITVSSHQNRLSNIFINHIFSIPKDMRVGFDLGYIPNLIGGLVAEFSLFWELPLLVPRFIPLPDFSEVCLGTTAPSNHCSFAVLPSP